jgi:RimJ/RimL family protein N-acetyltransferase
MQEWIRPIVLEGQVVRLEPLEARHAPGLLAAASPDLFRFTPQRPDAWNLAGFERDVATVNAMGDTVAFAVIHRRRGVVIGRTTYMDIQPAHRGVEIGRTWISRPHQGTLVNPEMKLLMMRHAFETLRAIRVQYTTGHLNVQSQRAIARLGAVREGVRRQDRISPDGTVRDTIVFSVVSEEWPMVKAGLLGRLGQLGSGPGS